MQLSHSFSYQAILSSSEEADMTCYELLGGRMAKILHKGPYEKTADSYKKLFKWIAENHKKMVGPTR